MEGPGARAAVLRSALLLGGELAVDIFRAWRRDLSCIDALILLAVTRSNIDGILYDRTLRGRFGGASRIAPDDLRQPVSQSVVALSLGLPERVVGARIMLLAARGECELTPNGMLITAQQVEATARAQIIRSAYDALRRCYLRLRAAGFFRLEPPLPLETAAEPPIRSAAAHGAKYLLRLISTLAVPAGDLIDALLLLEILRHDAGAPDSLAVGRSIGVRPRDAKRRIDALVANEVCRLDENDALTVGTDASWFAEAAERNMGHLFQLCAGLAEVGAAADFESALLR
jgi:hypothetical protein